MATGRVTRVRTKVPQGGVGRVTRVRVQTTGGVTGVVTRVRSKATAAASTVQPYDTVNLGAGTWTQTGGPTVTVPTFTAPALRGGAVLTFTSTTGGTASITVKPHTLSRVTAAGLQPYRTYMVGTVPPNNGFPLGNLPGWTQIVATDYLSDVPQGSSNSVEVAYPGHKLFDNFVDTSHNGTYDKTSRTTYVQNSCLVQYLHYDATTGKYYVSCVLPNGYTGQQYGKWTWRMKAPGGTNVAEYKIVPLLWPANDTYGDGEIDYPENTIGSTSAIQINPHTALGPAQAGESNGTTVAGQDVTGWHIYDIEWTPANIKISLDGVVVRTILSTSIAWPPGPMRWEIQAEVANTTVGSAPPATTSIGIVYTDWVAIYTYTP